MPFRLRAFLVACATGLLLGITACNDNSSGSVGASQTAPTAVSAAQDTMPAAAPPGTSVQLPQRTDPRPRPRDATSANARGRHRLPARDHRQRTPRSRLHPPAARSGRLSGIHRGVQCAGDTRGLSDPPGARRDGGGSAARWFPERRLKRTTRGRRTRPNIRYRHRTGKRQSRAAGPRGDHLRGEGAQCAGRGRRRRYRRQQPARALSRRPRR